MGICRHPVHPVLHHSRHHLDLSRALKRSLLNKCLDYQNKLECWVIKLAAMTQEKVHYGD